MSFNRIIPRVQYAEKLPDPVGHVAPSPSALSSLLVDVEIDEDFGEAYRLRTDNYLVLHQKDIENRIGVDNVRKWIEALNQNSTRSADSYQQALDKLSDRDLFSLVRSRHIQAPSEVSSYAQQILEDAQSLAHRRDALLARNAELAAARASATADSSSVSENSDA